mgnify:CR=1 FL=1
MDFRTLSERLAEEMEASSNKDNFVNFIVGGFDPEIASMVFQGEAFTTLASESDMFDILILSGVFKSKSQAKQNWTKTDKEIEHGLCSFVVGKKKMSISVFKPCEN